MSRRPDVTVILCSGGFVMRGDFVGKSHPRMTNSVRADLDPSATVLQGFHAVQNAKNPLGRRLLLFSSSLWTSRISLPRQTVVGLEQHELEQALKYEVETLAGIEADEVILAARHAGDDGANDFYWITVLPQTEWSAISDQLIASKVRSIGMAHPTGVQARIGENPTLVRRIEFWANLVAAFPEGSSIPSSTSHCAGDSLRWMEDMGLSQVDDLTHTTRFVIGPNASRMLPDANLELLEDEQRIRDWLTDAAAADLADRIPILTTRRTSSVPNARLAVGVAIILLALGACLWHALWLNRRIERVVDQIALLQVPAAAKRRYDEDLNRITQERADLASLAAKTQEQVQRIQFLFNQQTVRFSRLLDLLVQVRTDDLLIEELLPNEKGTMISGISLNGESAPLFANRLRDLARPLGWQVNPATQIGEKKMTSGGPWQFKILLEDIGPSEVASIPASGTTPVADEKPTEGNAPVTIQLAEAADGP